MAKGKMSDAQTIMGDLLLQIDQADTYILITINGDEVSVWSTLESDSETAMYLQGAAKAVVANG